MSAPSVRMLAPSERVEPTRSSPQRRRKVEHLWWVAAAHTAAQLGVYEVPSVCGRAWVEVDPADSLLVRVKRQADGSKTTDCGPEVCHWCELRVRQGPPTPF